LLAESNETINHCPLTSVGFYLQPRDQNKVSRTFLVDASFGKNVLVENTTLQQPFSNERHQGMTFKVFLMKTTTKNSQKNYNRKKFSAKPCCFKRKLDNFPAIIQQKFVYLCVRIFIQIKAVNELRVARM